MKKLLVVVDMQNDFIGGPLGTKEAEAVVPAVAARIKRAKADGDEILFTRDTHGDDYLRRGGETRRALLRGTYGWQIDGRLDADGAI
ncbi:MAG: cysteine hydrolase family protein [Candidatus Borkfalkia sp.]